MKDAVAFMRWERVVPWKILSLKANEGKRRADKRPVPVGFGSRSAQFMEQLEPGSRIWVLTRIQGKLSLAGCVKVRKVVDRDAVAKTRWPQELADLMEHWQFVASADPAESEFFETNDAEPVKAALGIRFSQSRTIQYFDGSLEDAFRQCTAQGRKTVFLSYTWSEGRPFALSLAKTFRRHGWSPWLDAMSVPEYTLQGENHVSRRRLKELIQLGIKHCSLAVIIDTPSFGSSAWTKMERDHIHHSGVPHFRVIPAKPAHGSFDTILGAKPEAVVQSILERAEEKPDLTKAPKRMPKRQSRQ